MVKAKKVKAQTIKKIVKKPTRQKKSPLSPATLERHTNNPIISPSYYPWESKATFNPTAFISKDKVHIIYRAIGDDDSSALGYANSYDGKNIENRPTYAIYQRSSSPDMNLSYIGYISGGGWSGGCEDPRVTVIDDTLYLVYTAFDGWGSVRLALSSILLSDFEKKKWNWSKSVMISPPGEIHKNWVIFPEKINGKFVVLHSISPKISLTFIDDMKQFNGNYFIKSSYSNEPIWGKKTWDNMVRGVGPAPIKTRLGWLVLFHSMDRNDPDRYKLGAVILDYKDPTLMLYHSKHPILEPDTHYENNGHKAGVVYSCGAVAKDGELIVYYGGADKFVCVASIELEELLESLEKDKVVKLKNNKIIKS